MIGGRSVREPDSRTTCTTVPDDVIRIHLEKCSGNRLMPLSEGVLISGPWLEATGQGWVKPFAAVARSLGGNAV